MFTFQTLSEDAKRYHYWVSAGKEGKAIGTANQDYNSVWSLRHANGVSFYMFNELNQVYMGAPGDNCPLTATPSVAFSFEIVDAANGVVEMKCNGQTLHVGNDGDGKLLNYDQNEAASRWYIRTIDVAADIQTILDGLTEADYAVVPALGQYPTAAYEALVEARTSARTVEEVNAAIAAFKRAKNSPVFTISGPKDYVVGKSMYENEGHTNAKGNDLYFKTTNKYDKTMWWVFDQTTETVGVTESVAVKNYVTGNPVWGVENLKITETSENDTNDGIFLFYTVGNNTPLHFQSDGQLITRWDSKDKASGSAVIFTYVGNTYDLDKLTDEIIEVDPAEVNVGEIIVVRPGEKVPIDGVVIEGIENCLIKFSKCCSPLPGDEIIGFITRGHGVSIHKRDCTNVPKDVTNCAEPARWVNAYWNKNVKEDYKATLQLTCLSRIGLMAEVAMQVANMRVNITNISTHDMKDGRTIIELTVNVASIEHLKNLIAKIDKIILE